LAVTAGRPTGGALLPARLAALTGSRAGSLAIFIARRILWMIPIVFFVILIGVLVVRPQGLMGATERGRL